MRSLRETPETLMTKNRLWMWIAIAVAAVVVVGVIIWVSVANSGEPAPTSSPTASQAPAETPTPSPTPTASETPTPTPTAQPTCEELATAEFLAMTEESGSVSWQTQDEEIGARPFADFPGGAPEGQVICRWGEDPDLETDNVIDLAWAPMPAVEQADAQAMLTQRGYGREDGDAGVWFVASLDDGGDAYLFTDDDVRWSMSQEFVGYIDAPATP
jgi:hypothetical protein